MLRSSELTTSIGMVTCGINLLSLENSPSQGKWMRTDQTEGEPVLVPLRRVAGRANVNARRDEERPTGCRVLERKPVAVVEWVAWLSEANRKQRVLVLDVLKAVPVNIKVEV